MKHVNVFNKEMSEKYTSNAITPADFKAISSKDQLVSALKKGFEFGPNVIGKHFAITGIPREDKMRKYLTMFPLTNAKTNAKVLWNQYQMGSLLVREPLPTGGFMKSADCHRTWYMYSEDENKLIQFFYVSDFREYKQGGNLVVPTFAFDWLKVTKLKDHGAESVALLQANWGDIEGDAVKRGKRRAYLKDLRIRQELVKYVDGEYLTDGGKLNKAGMLIRQGALIIDPFFPETTEG